MKKIKLIAVFTSILLCFTACQSDSTAAEETTIATNAVITGTTTVATETKTSTTEITTTVAETEVTTTVEETTIATTETTIEETVVEAVVQIEGLPDFVAEKHNLTWREIDGDIYNTTVYEVSDDTYNYILVVETVMHGVPLEINWFMYDMQGSLIFEHYSAEVTPEYIWLTEDNGAPAIIVEYVARESELYKYNITENGVTETYCGTLNADKVINGLYADDSGEVTHSVNEEKDEVTYYVNVDGIDKVLYKVVCADSVYTADYSVSEIALATITELYHSSKTAD